MLVSDFLEGSARRLPDKVALICRQERLTYGEIDRRAEALGVYLRDLGVGRQDRVAILLDNSVEAIVALFGILKVGAIFVMLGATTKTAKLSYILKDCGVKALVTHRDKSENVHAAVKQTDTLCDILWVGDSLPSLAAGGSPVRHHPFSSAQLRGTGSSAIRNSNIDLDLASIIYTSGSTGDPKGVMLTHSNMASASASIIGYLGNQEDDIIMNALPLAFDYGLYQVLMAIRFGGTVVLEKSFAYPYAIIQKMVQERVTGFPGVPTVFAILLELKDKRKLSLPSLRYITSTAAVLPVSHIEKLREIFPNAKIYSMYGLTECKRVSFLPPEEIDRRPASVGRGMPNEEVWIVDGAGNQLGPNVVGELVVRGSNVMRGYWGLTEETDSVLKPGKYPGEVVLYTGDLFRMDDEGYLYFVGRKDDMIKSRGERISPQEIERCLCAIEGVAEAAVIGVEDNILGQAIVAYVRCENGYAEDERKVLKHCRDKLEACMVPKAIRFVESFERTGTGKIDRLRLKAREMAA